MIKVTVMYPNTPGARFDHEYYRDKHMPLLKARMGDSCKRYTVDKGLAGGAPGAPAPYIGMCHIFCDSIRSISNGFYSTCARNHGRHCQLHRSLARDPDQRSRCWLTGEKRTKRHVKVETIRRPPRFPEGRRCRGGGSGSTAARDGAAGRAARAR